MFAVWCRRHRARVLLSASSITALEPSAGGIVIRWRCTCGETGANRPHRVGRREPE